MKKFVFLWIGIVLLAACSQQKAEQPTVPPPTPTSITLGLAGPMLSPNPGAAEEESACTAESGCVVIPEEVAAEDALPLTTQEINGLTLGVPEGYRATVSGEDVIISAVSLDAEGGFMVSLRQVDETPDAIAWEQGAAINTDHISGHWLLKGKRGAVALLTTSAGKQVYVEAFSSPGYWAAFQATFEAMLASVTF